MSFKDSVYSESTLYGLFKSLLTPFLRPATCKTIFSIFNNFFFFQFVSALLPGRVPVSKVDHPLDEKIPFTPSWVTIYIDFTQYWIRMAAFFLRRYGRGVYTPVRDFIMSMGSLYASAAKVYRKNLSTTKRPFYIGRPRFLMIHLCDPHLMCVPSLHVMVVIHAYEKFKEIAKQTGDEIKLAAQILELKLGALAICQAIFFVKQHSINCIPAALYAVTNLDSDIFSAREAEDFIDLLFSPPPERRGAPASCRVHPASAPLTEISKESQAKIKSHILSLYHRFIEEGKTAASWEAPIIKFLQTYNKERV